jgi:hypothetical protein
MEVDVALGCGQRRDDATQEPTALANLDCEELKNRFVGVVAKDLGVHYVVSVKSVESLPTT